MMSSSLLTSCEHMNYTILVSETFQKKFYYVDKKIQEKMKKALIKLNDDPFRSRPNCDIKPLKDTKPKKHRLRIGEYRIIYIVQRKEIKVIDLIKRKSGYAQLE